MSVVNKTHGSVTWRRWPALLVSLVMMLSLPALHAGKWRQLKPDFGAPVNSIVVDASGDIYVSAPTNFKSTDSGQNWTSLALPGKILGADPLIAGTLYAAGTSFVRSTDGGKTWGPMQFTPSLPVDTYPLVRSIAISPANPNVMYVSTVAGLYASTDRGASWNLRSPDFSNQGGALAVDPTNANRVFATTSLGLYRSDDIGLSWTRLSDTNRDWWNCQLYVAAANPNVLYAASQNDQYFHGTVLKSSDGGNTWTDAGRPVPTQPGDVGQLVISPTDSNVVYATSSGGIRKTTNGGGVWNLFFAPQSSSSAMSALWFDPRNSANIYAGSLSGFYRSADGGASWTQQNTGIADAVITGIEICRDAPQTIYEGVRGTGYWKSTDSGATWRMIRGGDYEIGGVAVDPHNPDILLISPHDILRTTDGGNTFVDVNGVFSSTFRFNPLAPNYVFGEGIVSRDGGVTWTAPTGHFASAAFTSETFDFHPTIPGIVIGVWNQSYCIEDFPQGPDSGVLVWSNDKGESWSMTSLVSGSPCSNAGIGPIALDKSDPSTLYVAYSPPFSSKYLLGKVRLGYGGPILGSVSSLSPTGLTDDVVNLLYDQATSSLYAITGSGGVLQSTDQAATWTSLTAGLPYAATGPMAVPPDGSQLLVATTGGIWAYTTTQTVTIASVPAGLAIVADGVSYTAPHAFSWSIGSGHTISVVAPQAAGAGIRYSFAGWSDGGAQSHTITVPSTDTSYTANFVAQYQLTTSVSPAGSGTVATNFTTSDQYYNAGTPLTLTATANSGFQFSGWSGAPLDSNASLIMNGPKTVTANFIAKAAIVSPAPGSILAGTTVTFTWSAGTGASSYWLDVGTSPYVGNIFGGSVGSATSKQVTGLPVDGVTVYVTLYTNVNGSYTDSTGAYYRNSYTYTAGNIGAITSPSPSSTLPGSSTTFTWTPATGATGYWLDVGTAPYVGNIFGGAVGLVTSRQVTGLPEDGSTVYVTLYSNINGSYTDAGGAYFRNSYTYTSIRIGAIASPAHGSTLNGSAATFTWTPAVGGTGYWLDVGTTPFVGNIFGGPVGTVTSKQITGLPLDGSIVYVSLYSNVNGSYTDPAGAYFRNSYTYTSTRIAVITSPAPGSTLTGAVATFVWSAATGATGYWLDVGTAPFVGNIFGGPVGTVTSKQITGLPVDGSTVYVTIYSNINGSYTDSTSGAYFSYVYMFTAAK